MTSMKVCIIGDFDGPPDEGMKNTARYFSEALGRQGGVVFEADVNEYRKPSFYQDISRFGPDIIHYIPGIGVKNLLLMKLLSVYTDAETAISAIYPKSGIAMRTVERYLPPGVVFVQTPRERANYSRTTNTEVLPNGVDMTRFRPLEGETRRAARDRFDISPDARVVLHVGHSTERRGLSIMTDIQNVDENAQVIIAASNHFSQDSGIARELEEAGCKLIDGYISDVQELYGAAECYVFPTEAGDTIQTPLSILEAMSCNLPVVTRSHPGISSIFDSGDGLRIEDDDAAFIEAVRQYTNGRPVETRSKVADYSWSNIAARAMQVYRDIL